MISSTLGIMITTVSNRKKVLTWNLQHLLKHIQVPFSVYIYSDDGKPIKEDLINNLPNLETSHMKLEVFNENKEISNKRIGCGGARHFLFELAKKKHEVVVSLDDDMQITEGWYEAIEEAIREHPKHSVFTGVIKDGRDGNIIAGSNMVMDGNILKRLENRQIPEKYGKTEWGPLGALVLCRESLHSHVQIPKLFVREDSAFYLELKKLGINETIVSSKAVMIHKPFDVPSSGLRVPRKLKEAKEFFRDEHGIDRE